MRMKIHFRQFLPWVSSLALLTTTGASFAASVGTGPSFKGPIGLQLYSLREQFGKDVPGTLDEVKSMGFKYAELAGTYGMPPEKFKQELNARGIKPIAAHFAYERYRDDAEGIAKEAKELGLAYAGCAWIPHSGDFDEKTTRPARSWPNTA